eukprot:13520309-Heterocapsa_arctica.AAC.2
MDNRAELLKVLRAVFSLPIDVFMLRVAWEGGGANVAYMKVVQTSAITDTFGARVATAVVRKGEAIV